MARPKHTKTHNIFLIDKNKLPGMSGATEPPVEDALAALMGMDQKYQLQRLKTEVNTRGFSVWQTARTLSHFIPELFPLCFSFGIRDTYMQ